MRTTRSVASAFELSVRQSSHDEELVQTFKEQVHDFLQSSISFSKLLAKSARVAYGIQSPSELILDAFLKGCYASR